MAEHCAFCLDDLPPGVEMKNCTCTQLVDACMKGPAAVNLTPDEKRWPLGVRFDTPDSRVYELDMPGLEREDVLVTVRQGTQLVIEGNGKEYPDGRKGRRYERKFDLAPVGRFKIHQINAVMKAGILVVRVPKINYAEVVTVNVA